MPPSSSKIDCDALDAADCAPSNGVKVNILIACRHWRGQWTVQGCYG